MLQLHCIGILQAIKFTIKKLIWLHLNILMRKLFHFEYSLKRLEKTKKQKNDTFINKRKIHHMMAVNLSLVEILQ